MNNQTTKMVKTHLIFIKSLLLFILCCIFAESVLAKQPVNGILSNSNVIEFENCFDIDVKALDITPPIKRKQCVYIELGGAGILFSLNYDSRFRGSKGLGISAGVSAIGMSDIAILMFPVSLNYLFDLNETGKHHIELGLGVNANFVALLPFAVAGYRYQPVKGLLFKAGITPVYMDGKPLLSGGISLGFSF